MINSLQFISQNKVGIKYYLETDTDQIQFEAKSEGQSNTVNIYANCKWYIALEDENGEVPSSSWLRVNPMVGDGNDTITISIDQDNSLSYPRILKVVIKQVQEY